MHGDNGFLSSLSKSLSARFWAGVRVGMLRFRRIHDKIWQLRPPTKVFFESFCCHVATLVDIQLFMGGNKGGNNMCFSAKWTNKGFIDG